MSDFIIQIGRTIPADVIAESLRNGPGMETRSIRTFELQWGTVTVQVPSGTGYKATFVSGHVAAAAIEKSSHLVQTLCP